MNSANKDQFRLPTLEAMHRELVSPSPFLIASANHDAMSIVVSRVLSDERLSSEPFRAADLFRIFRAYQIPGWTETECQRPKDWVHSNFQTTGLTKSAGRERYQIADPSISQIVLAFNGLALTVRGRIPLNPFLLGRRLPGDTLSKDSFVGRLKLIEYLTKRHDTKVSYTDAMRHLELDRRHTLDNMLETIANAGWVDYTPKGRKPTTYQRTSAYRPRSLRTGTGEVARHIEKYVSEHQTIEFSALADFVTEAVDGRVQPAKVRLQTSGALNRLKREGSLWQIEGKEADGIIRYWQNGRQHAAAEQLSHGIFDILSLKQSRIDRYSNKAIDFVNSPSLVQRRLALRERKNSEEEQLPVYEEIFNILNQSATPMAIWEIADVIKSTGKYPFVRRGTIKGALGRLEKEQAILVKDSPRGRTFGVAQIS